MKKDYHTKNKYYIIGIMSGTSLDGLDLAYCSFQKTDSRWIFDVLHGETIPYTEEWKSRLHHICGKSALEFVKCDNDFGHFIGKELNRFINTYRLSPDLISSHGHTIFHQPSEGFTTQIGNGSVIRSYVDAPVVFDFRSLDIALGGQGAPLVPIGDELLFSDYDCCLNLGGISNISYRQNGQRTAYDISPCNMALNYLANKLGLVYDKGGAVAACSYLNTDLYTKLNALNYYTAKGPKTLSKEWFDNYFKPLLDETDIPVDCQLRTVSEHIAYQIAASLSNHPKGKLIITGGGAFNTFLIEKLREQVRHQIVLPSESIINYKEALIFAFLGLLKMQGEINSLASVTGAQKNSCSGCIV